MGFQARVREFLNRHDLSYTPQTHALDLTSEVGEVAKALLESSDYGRSAAMPSAALEEEMGDAFFSLIALAESLGVDLEAALFAVLEKYRVRLAIKGQPGSRDTGE